MHILPKALARSLVDSVFPVPAGPAGADPSPMLRAEVIVIQHLSVSGVMTILVVGPMYSDPYLNDALICLMTRLFSFPLSPPLH